MGVGGEGGKVGWEEDGEGGGIDIWGRGGGGGGKEIRCIGRAAGRERKNSSVDGLS